MENLAPGFFGKMPGRGDFVTRRLNRGFLDAWDGWLQSAVADSKTALGDEWLNTYLTSPLWRFVLGKNVCNDNVWAGVMMPSVDRVGRYFPLTIAAPLSGTENPFRIAEAGHDWFDRTEIHILTALDEEEFDLDGFDRAVEALGDPVTRSVGGDCTGSTGYGPTRSMRVGLESVNELGDAFCTLLEQEFDTRFQTYSLWWSSGSDLVAPSLAVCPGLPPAEAYASLLAGHWQEHLWQNLTEYPPLPVSGSPADIDEPESA